MSYNNDPINKVTHALHYYKVILEDKSTKKVVSGRLYNTEIPCVFSREDHTTYYFDWNKLESITIYKNGEILILVERMESEQSN